jgi:probable rRNA maturation factor
MLRRLELEAAELSVYLTSDAVIKRLNLAYRGKDRPTDVLAFPLDGAPRRRSAPAEPHLLGDIVISLHAAKRQADARKRPLIEELRLLLAHGLLHLLGYDHATLVQKRRMRAMTRQLVRAAALPEGTEELASRTKRPKPARRGSG